MIGDCIGAAIKVVGLIDDYIAKRTKELIEYQTLKVDIEDSIQRLRSLVRRTQDLLSLFEATEPVVEEQDICKKQISVLLSLFHRSSEVVSSSFNKLHDCYKKKHKIDFKVYPQEEYVHDIGQIKTGLERYMEEIKVEYDALEKIINMFQKFASKSQAKFKPLRALWIVNGWDEYDASIASFINYCKGKKECFKCTPEMWENVDAFLTYYVLKMGGSHVATHKNGSYVLDYSIMVGLTNQNCTEWKTMYDCVMFLSNSAKTIIKDKPKVENVTIESIPEKKPEPQVVVKTVFVEKEVQSKTPKKDAFKKYCEDHKFTDSTHIQLKEGEYNSCLLNEAKAFLLSDNWGPIVIYPYRSINDAKEQAWGQCAKIILDDQAIECFSGGVGLPFAYDRLRSCGRVWLAQHLNC
jgi:hypothetical protein